MGYDDLMGLDMYDDGMSGLLDMGMARDQAIAAGASAASIILAAWALPKLPTPKDWAEVNQHRLRAGVGILGGMLLGRGLWNYNRDAAMAVTGAVSGLALAQLVDTFFDANLLGGGYPLGAMPDGRDNQLSAGDEALLSAYGRDNSSALSSLEATSVQASRGAFHGLGGPIVSNEALMGFGATEVVGQTLGEEPYQGYLA